MYILLGFHHLYNNVKLDTTTTGMSIKGQQLHIHYEDFTTYIITGHHNHRNVDQGTATAYTLGFHHLYNNFKLDTTTTGMSIKGQQLRIHYEDFTTYIITLNWTPQPLKCQSRDSNCIYTTWFPHIATGLVHTKFQNIGQLTGMVLPGV